MAKFIMIEENEFLGHVRRILSDQQPAVVLRSTFFLELANLLEYSEHQLLEGESLDLDELAQIISTHVRPNLAVVYGHREGGGGAQAGPLGPSTGDANAAPPTSSAAPVVPS